MVIKSRTLSSELGSDPTRASRARSAPEQNTGPAARITVAPTDGSSFSARQAATRSLAGAGVMVLRGRGALRGMVATPPAARSTSPSPSGPASWPRPWLPPGPGSLSVIGAGLRLGGLGGLSGLEGLGGLGGGGQSLEPELSQVRIVSHAPIVDDPPGGIGHDPAPAVAVPVVRHGQGPDHVLVSLVHLAVVLVEDVGFDLDPVDLVEDHVLDQLQDVPGRAFGQEYEAAAMAEPRVRPVETEKVRKARDGDAEVSTSVILAPFVAQRSVPPDDLIGADHP